MRSTNIPALPRRTNRIPPPISVDELGCSAACLGLGARCIALLYSAACGWPGCSLDFRDGGIFLIPPFAATLTILVYQPNVSIAQPVAVVCGSLLGAAIGTVLTVLLGFGPRVALLAALT